MKNDTYYSPPIEWTIDAIRRRYEQLAKSFKIKEPLPLKFGSGSELVELKRALGEISGAVKNQDQAAVELAIEFVLSDVYFHTSGYIRATMARSIKSAVLSETSKERLRRGLFRLFSSGAFGPEHRELASLLRRIGLGSMEEQYKKLRLDGGKQQRVAQELYKR